MFDLKREPDPRQIVLFEDSVEIDQLLNSKADRAAFLRQHLTKVEFSNIITLRPWPANSNWNGSGEQATLLAFPGVVLPTQETRRQARARKEQELANQLALDFDTTFPETRGPVAAVIDAKESSLNIDASEEGASLADRLAADEESIEVRVIAADRRSVQLRLTKMAMDRLPERERRILNERLLNDANLQSLADELGISRERVRQIQVEATAKVRRFVEAAVTEDWALEREDVFA